MRHFIIALLLMASVPCFADVDLSATCDAGGLAKITVVASSGGMTDGFVGLALQRERVGGCEGAEPLNTEPLPLPAPGDELVHVIDSQIPSEGDAYRFEVLGVDADGGLHTLQSTHTSWGPAVAFTGRVRFLGAGRYRLVGCDDACWRPCLEVAPSDLNVTELEMLIWANNNRTITVTALPSDLSCFTDVTDVKVTSSCTPTPAEHSSWGDIKSRFR